MSNSLDARQHLTQATHTTSVKGISDGPVKLTAGEAIKAAKGAAITRKAPHKAPEGEWTSVGTGAFSDNLFNAFDAGNATWDVEIEQSATDPAWYRLAPLTADASTALKALNEVDPTAYMYVDTTDPANVKFDDFSCYGGEFVFTQKYFNQFGTLADNVITFPQRSIVMEYNGGAYYANSNGPVTIYLPGADVKNYSMEIGHDAYCTADNKHVVDFATGKDIASVKLMIMPGSWKVSNNVGNATYVGKNGQTFTPTDGALAININAATFDPGIYTVLAVGLDAEGTVQAAREVNFIVAEDATTGWKTLGTTTYKEILYSGSYTGNDTPAEIEVTVMESTTTPGRYYLVNPYATFQFRKNGVALPDHGHVHGIIINATIPTQVYVEATPLGFNYAGEGAAFSLAGEYLSSGASAADVEAEGLFGTATTNEDGSVSVSMPAGSVSLGEKNYANGKFYVSSLPFEITIPAPAKEVEPTLPEPEVTVDGTEPVGAAVLPAVAALTDGAQYYIYDAHADNGTDTEQAVSNTCRYAFRNDNNGTVLGTHLKPANAYGKLDNTHVWTAHKSGDNWQFENVGTGKWFGSGKTTVDAAAAATLVLEPTATTGTFTVLREGTSDRWDGNPQDFVYWAGSGHPIKFFSALEGENGAYNFAADASYSVTVNYNYNGATIATYTKVGTIGTEYSFTAPMFWEGAPYAGAIEAKNITVNIELVGNKFPFAASASLEDATWQALYMHGTYSNLALKYNADTNSVIGEATALTSAEPYDDAHLFAIVGSLNEGFKLYSKAAGTEVALTADIASGLAVLAPAADATLWQLAGNNGNDAGKFVFKTGNGQGGLTCLNLQPVSGVWTLKFWWDADNGSTIWSYGVSQPVINNYKAQFEALATQNAADEAIVATCQEAIAFLNGLNAYEALSEETIAKINEFHTAIELPTAIAAAKNAVLAYFNASYTGAQYGANYLSYFNDAKTVAEVESIKEYLIGRAASTMLSDMENGFMLKNVRNGKYFFVDEVESTDENGESVFTQAFSKTADSDIYSYFKAELEGDYSVAPADRTFKLRNVLTGLYVGVQTEANTPVPAVAAEDAATLKLVAGDNGFELMIVAEGQENLFLNADTRSEGTIVIYPYANDGGAFWAAEALPMLDKNAVKVNFVGQTVTSEWGSVSYTSVEGIEVKVPVGATVTEVAKLTAVMTPDGEEAQVIFETNFEGAVATEGEMVEYVSSWNDETYTVETTEVKTPCLVYAFNFNPVRTQAGTYAATLATASFCAEGKYSVATEADYTQIQARSGFNVVVTPAEGEVENITLITLDNATGMAPVAESGLTITLNYGEKNILTIDEAKIAEFDSFNFDTFAGPYYTIPVELTTGENGTYTLTIPAGFFEDDNMTQNAETVVTWEVSKAAGIATITNVTVNGKVYDLQGREVKNATRGLFIINGQKTVIK